MFWRRAPPPRLGLVEVLAMGLAWGRRVGSEVFMWVYWTGIRGAPASGPRLCWVWAGPGEPGDEGVPGRGGEGKHRVSGDGVGG